VSFFRASKSKPTSLQITNHIQEFTREKKEVMSEEIERHVVRKFEICQRLGKVEENKQVIKPNNFTLHRLMELFGKLLKKDPVLWLL
jgi:hypothetical protein